MLHKLHYEKILYKFQHFERKLNAYLFEKIESLSVSAFVTKDQYHSIPDDNNFEKIESGWRWGEESAYCWIKAEYTVPESLSGKDIFVMPGMGGYEAMLWVDGVPFGTFNTKITYTAHGNHYCGLVRKNAKAGEKIEIAVEYYAGHTYHGCNPFSPDYTPSFDYAFNSLDICVKNEEIADIYFDLKIVLQLALDLPDESFMKAAAVNALTEAHKHVYYFADDVSEEVFLKAVKEIRPYMKKVLSMKNGDVCPEVGLVGHSHMDTAWLWHVDETVKKCARTFSNQLSLMEQYPCHRFVQSSACHSDMIRKHYPELFSRIQKKVEEGRYEPNGAVWVECDCNITSGESMIRQFMWGQRFCEKYFNYRADAFWLPDTFGYCASIPQIMKGCGVDYFLTTKLSWNDTNSFPYNTFYWQGIDGTRVFTHFNTIQSFPDVNELRGCFANTANNKNQPTVTNKRLMAYGFGDGGGGPQFEMLEMAKRLENLCDVPRSYFTSVSDFMKDLETTCIDPNTYRGELYLELHRGTLTNQHEIKYNNRKAEFLLRDLEFLTVCESIKKRIACDAENTNKHYETLLINQFHDILPGTCINRAHEECKAQMRSMIKAVKEDIANITGGEGKCISVINTLSFDRDDTIFAADCEKSLEGVYQQIYKDIDGKDIRLIRGVSIPAFSSVQLNYGAGKSCDCSPFTYDGEILKTPFATVKFDENGQISSFVDERAKRELVTSLPLNTFLMAEDVPVNWDNWDIDPDIELKLKPCATLLEREVVSHGDVAFIVRSKYRISEKSTVKQDMIFFADSPEVRFDTLMDWQDDHRFLKVAFDAGVWDDHARHEIQFGYTKRPTTRNNSIEQAKFEVCNHKYTDISEPAFGVAVLNDCKYGVSVKDSCISLSLHKGGTHPDVKGDKGIHRATYSFLPHNEGFSAESVIRPAYMLNVPCILSEGSYEIKSPVKVDRPNIIVETVKPCEDRDRAYIIRLYEAEGSRTNCTVKLSDAVKKYAITNMLEEEIEGIKEGNTLDLNFGPFEIKTIKAYY
ncbi:MAG: alpha-mannosidase [Clostridia bacterium]|nr:alpha-mannosidase [Clostridia bacterium]